MKYVIALVAAFALLGFTAFTHAEAAPKHKVAKGHLVKVDGTSLTYKAGRKGTGKEHTIKTDDSTKVTLDDKEAKLADLKEGVYLEITEEKGVATTIAASSTTPASTKDKAAK